MRPKRSEFCRPKPSADLPFLSTQVSPPFGRKLKPFVSFQDSSRALRPLIEPISPPPPPVSSAVSCAASHGGHPCARALQSVTHNYDHYLQSLPQKQKEYHALVVEATESANYPFQRLAAPLLLAKQQQMLIERGLERGLERGVRYWPPEGSREQQRALQTRTVQSHSPYAIGGQERQLVNTHHQMATQRPPQRQFVDPNAQRRLQPLAPLSRPQLTTTSGGRQQLFVPTSGPPLVSRPLLMPSTVQNVRHVTQRPPQRPLMTSPHSLHMTSPPQPRLQPRPQPLRQSQHAATLTPPFGHSSDIRLNRALSVTTTMTSLTAQSAQRFSSLSHSNHVAVSHVTAANATPRQSVVRIAPFVTSSPQPMRASVLRSPTESRASSQAVIQSIVLDPKVSVFRVFPRILTLFRRNARKSGHKWKEAPNRRNPRFCRVFCSKRPLNTRIFPKWRSFAAFPRLRANCWKRSGGGRVCRRKTPSFRPF